MDHGLLTEVIPPETVPQDPSTVPQDPSTVTRSPSAIYESGVFPDWWKLPPAEIAAQRASIATINS